MVRVRLKPDGTLAAPPEVLNSGTQPVLLAHATAPSAPSSAVSPIDMLKPEHYEQWKDIEITFDPRDMIRG